MDCSVGNPAIITQTLLDQDMTIPTLDLSERNLLYPNDVFYRDYTAPARIAFPSLYESAQHCVAWPGAGATEITAALVNAIYETRNARQTVISALPAPVYQGFMNACGEIGTDRVVVQPSSVYAYPAQPNTVVLAQSPNNPDGRLFEPTTQDENAFFVIDIAFQAPCYAGRQAPTINTWAIQQLRLGYKNVAIINSLSMLGFPGVRYGFCLLNDGNIASNMVSVLKDSTFRPSLCNLQLAQSVCTNYIGCAADRLLQIHPKLQSRIRQIRELLPPTVQTSFYDDPRIAVNLPFLFCNIPVSVWTGFGVRCSPGSEYNCPPGAYSRINLMINDAEWASLLQIVASEPFQQLSMVQ